MRMRSVQIEPEIAQLNLIITNNIGQGTDKSRNLRAIADLKRQGLALAVIE